MVLFPVEGHLSTATQSFPYSFRCVEVGPPVAAALGVTDESINPPGVAPERERPSGRRQGGVRLAPHAGLVTLRGSW